MKNGFDSIVTRLFNKDGNLVFEGVTRFSYVHTELADDASFFTIESNDVTLVDHPDLQDGKQLIVAWGYLGKIRMHKVWIFDITPTFDANGLRLEIKAYCKAAFIKQNSSQKVWTDKGADDMADEIASANGLTLEEKGLTPEDQKAESDVESVSTGGTTASKFDALSGKNTVARDNTAYLKSYAFKKWSAIPQANKPDAALLQDMFRDEPVDNTFVHGRDENLIIQRRNLNQAPYKSYTYRAEPGFLLSFSPSVKNSEQEKGATANVTGGWDDENKEFFQFETTQSQNSANVLGEMVNQSTEELNRRAIEEQEGTPIGQRVTVGGLLQEDFNDLNENGNPKYKLVKDGQIDSTKRSFVYIVKRGTRPSKDVFNAAGNPFVSTAIDNTGRIETRGLVIKDPKEYVHSMESDPQLAAGAAVNRQSRQIAKLFEAEAIILGDIELESSKIISINGVGKKYSGNYYITSVRHELTPDGGFLNYCSMFRTGTGKIESEIKNKILASNLGLSTNNVTGVPEDGTEKIVKVKVRTDR